MLRVLFVDDESEEVEIFKVETARFKQRVVPQFATSYDDAVGKIRSNFFHLAFVDLNLDDSGDPYDGVGLLRDCFKSRKVMILRACESSDRTSRCSTLIRCFRVVAHSLWMFVDVSSSKQTFVRQSIVWVERPCL